MNSYQQKTKNTAAVCLLSEVTTASSSRNPLRHDEIQIRAIYNSVSQC